MGTLGGINEEIKEEEEFDNILFTADKKAYQEMEADEDNFEEMRQEDLLKNLKETYELMNEIRDDSIENTLIKPIKIGSPVTTQ